MLEVNFNPFPVITTDRLVLRKARLDDVNDIFFLRSDPEVMKHIRKDPVKTLDEAKAWIQMVIDACESNTFILWNITLKGSEKTIGIISLWRLMKEHFRAEIGYTLHTAYHGKGIMSEAATTVIDFGFNTMKLHSIEAHINPTNSASQKLLERHNFVREAYFREYHYYKGEFSDTAIYSLLSTT